MSSDTNISTKLSGVPASANDAAAKPNNGPASDSTKKRKKSKSRQRAKEANDSTTEKKGNSQTRASKKDPAQSKVTNENSEQTTHKSKTKSKQKSKLTRDKKPKDTNSGKELARAVKERTDVERYDARFLRTPLIKYGSPALNLSVHHLPPTLSQADFLLQASKVAPSSAGHTSFSYQQGTQPAGLLDRTIYSVASYEFPSAEIANTVRLELNNQPFMDSASGSEFVCQVIKPIVGGVASVLQDEGDPAAAINSGLFKEFSLMREKEGSCDLSQIFEAMGETKGHAPTQETKKKAEIKKDERQKNQTKKKPIPKQSLEKKPSKATSEPPVNRSSEPAGKDKTPEGKTKRTRRRKPPLEKKVPSTKVDTEG